jgi:carbamoyl-phosphate synthase small subunit
VTPGLLVTADGDVFRGTSVGAVGMATGEVVFNTAMTGYQEIVTDPSYSGQVVVLTAPHIGNYGVREDDEQAGRPHVRALVTRSMSRVDSSWRSQGGFDGYLRSSGVVALSDVDTRRLTRLVRDRGAMPVAVGTDVDEKELADVAAAAPAMTGQDLVSGVTTHEQYRRLPEQEARGHVVAYDFGIKRDIIDAMTARGLAVTVVPASTTAEVVLAMRPDGVFLANGPGDPEPLTGAITAVRGLLGAVPVFGICLGHQILGLALGAETFKLPFGHHGGNHPVRRLADGRVEITSQNHGFAVDLWGLAEGRPPARHGVPGPDLLPAVVETAFGEVTTTHQNLNDGTLEGIACRDVAAFGVQYHPEAAPGPNDASVLFDRFVAMIGVE